MSTLKHFRFFMTVSFRIRGVLEGREEADMCNCCLLRCTLVWDTAKMLGCSDEQKSVRNIKAARYTMIYYETYRAMLQNPARCAGTAGCDKTKHRAVQYVVPLGSLRPSLTKSRPSNGSFSATSRKPR